MPRAGLNMKRRPADAQWVSANDYALVQGLRDTRETLDGWRAQPWRTLRGWLLGSMLVAVGLLFAVYVVAENAAADPTRLIVSHYGHEPRLADAGFLLYRNSLVLALHAMACVAGFIAGSSLPATAAGMTGAWRWVHEKAGPLAIGFVLAATIFSLTTQAYALGGAASTLAARLDISPALLLIGLLPHALPELTALFLPLAAWIIASRRRRWHELLAATFVTSAIAFPVLIVTALVEVYVSPDVLRALAA